MTYRITGTCEGNRVTYESDLQIHKTINLKGIDYDEIIYIIYIIFLDTDAKCD